MPKFIILAGGGKTHTWEIPLGDSVIGRDGNADLCLPNVSVSRRHATITHSVENTTEVYEWGKAKGMVDVVRVTDLESRNGIMVNKEKTECAIMEPNDVLQIGIFQLARMKDGDTFYKGRAIEYMTAWSGVMPASGVTHGMDPADVERLMQKQHTIQEGRMILFSNKQRQWFPEEGTLTFGGGGMVHLDGMRAHGVAAEVNWNGAAHVITKKGFLSKLIVNARTVSSHKLCSGDSIEICGTRFFYMIPE